MNTKLAAAVVVLLLVGGATAFVTGFGAGDGAETPASEPSSSTTDGGSDVTATATSDGGGGTGGSDATASASAPSTPSKPFGFSVEEIQQCGSTCRDVTITLANRRNESATGVTVTTHIYAGKEASGDPVWTGDEDVGRLGADGSYTTTERVRLSFSEALAVKSADGWITVRTTVRSDDETVTFTEQRDVDG